MKERSGTGRGQGGCGRTEGRKKVVVCCLFWVGCGQRVWQGKGKVRW